MFLNPCQNLVWAPLEENPPIIPSLLGSFSTEVFLNRSRKPGVKNSFPQRYSILMSYFQQLFQSGWVLEQSSIKCQKNIGFALFRSVIGQASQPIQFKPQSNGNSVTDNLSPLSSLHLYLFEFSLACSDIFQLYDWLSWLLFIRQSVEIRSNSTSYYQVNYTPSLVVPGQVKSIINQSAPIHSSQNLK